MGANILICTLIMWVATAAVVVPLANWLFARALSRNGELVALGGAGALTEELKNSYQALYNTKFIQADVLVLGSLGFMAGLAGFPLIGVAWQWRAWPGLLAMIGASFLGFHMGVHRPF